MVGISVLTLVPGELGGSETDARELLRGNHERLFEAFALLRRERPTLRLVLTGGGHSANVPEGVESRAPCRRTSSSRLAQAARFSWDETARGHDAVYGELSTRS